jgi:CelD/BcsL family acetyltransferase involved in cellulose biosynthesis
MAATAMAGRPMAALAPRPGAPGGVVCPDTGSRPPAAVATPSPALVNLYATMDFLDAVAKIYHPGRRCQVEDYALQDRVFRLLTVEGEGPVIAHPFLDIHEPLVPPPQPRPRKTVRWLPDVHHGTAALEAFDRRLYGGACATAPTTVWQDFPTWDRYLDLLRKRGVIRDDRRRRRRLEEAVGRLEFQVDDVGADVLPTTFRWKSTQYRRTTGIDLFAEPRHRAFFHELRARGLLRASTLRGGGRLLAVWLGAVHRQRWYGWIFGFDPNPLLVRYSVGRQLLYPMLEESHRAGHVEFDFSVGDEPYKRFFATHVRVVGPLGLPPIRYRLVSSARTLLRHLPPIYRAAKAARGLLRRAAAPA